MSLSEKVRNLQIGLSGMTDKTETGMKGRRARHPCHHIEAPSLHELQDGAGASLRIVLRVALLHERPAVFRDLAGLADQPEPAVDRFAAREELAESVPDEVFAVLFLLAGNRLVEQHRKPLAQPLRAGHAARLRDEQIGHVHQLVDLADEAEDLDVRMAEERIAFELLLHLLVVARAEYELDVLAMLRHIFEQSVVVVQQPPSASHDQDGRHVLQAELPADVILVAGSPEIRMDRDARHLDARVGHAVLHQLVLHDRGGDEIFVHFGIGPGAVRVVIRDEREQRDVQPEPLQARDDRVRSRMRADDRIRLELGDDLGCLGIEQPVQGELRETVERALVIRAIDAAPPLRLLRHRLPVRRDDQRAEHRIEKFAQFEHFRLDVGIEVPDADGKRVGGPGVPGTEPFREQQHSFLALVHRPTHFFLHIILRIVPDNGKGERAPEIRGQPLMNAVLSPFR